MTSKRTAAAATLCAALLSVGAIRALGGERNAGQPPATASNAASAAPPSYVEFGASGQAAALMAIARRVYRDTVGAPTESPLDTPGTSDRPAGPRDEPPPPEWPEGPTGVVVCLKVKDRVRACEGGRAPSSPDLVAAISALAERLSASDSRGRPGPVRARDLAGATLEAAFILRVEPVLGAGRSQALPDGIDAATVGFVVSSAGREMVVLPGELRSIKAALKLARRIGLAGKGSAEPEVGWYTPARIGSVPIVIP